MRQNNMKLLIAAFFISFLLLIGSLVIRKYEQSQFIAAPQKHPEAVKEISSNPSVLVIPKIGLHVRLVPGGIMQGKWILADTAVQFIPLTGDAILDDKLILYAHKRAGLFLALSDVNTSDSIFIITDKNVLREYRIYAIERAKPDEIEKLGAPDHTVVLFTCDGLFDQYRLVVKAKLISNRTIAKEPLSSNL